MTVLASFEKSLRQKAKIMKRQRGAWKLKLEQQLFKKLITLKDQLVIKEKPEVRLIHSNLFKKFGIDTDSLQNKFEDTCVVYHLVGFLVFKSSKIVNCEECCWSMERPSDDFGFVPPEGIYTEIKDFNCCLRYPSLNLFRIIVDFVEPIVSEMLAKNDLYGNVLARVVESLEFSALPKVGCYQENHSPRLLSKIIPYYIVMRFHFYSRCVRRSGFGHKTKTYRKEAKLCSK